MKPLTFLRFLTIDFDPVSDSVLDKGIIIINEKNDDL